MPATPTTAGALEELVGGRGRMGRPGDRGRAAGHEEAGEHDQGAEQVQPVGHGVGPREGDVGGADLQRHQVVAEAGGHLGREQEDHQGAVHGEHLVVGVLAHHLEPRLGQLGPDEQGQEPAGQEDREGGDDVEDADLLVVDRGQVVDDAARLLVVGLGERREGKLGGRHLSLVAP
jgi:hypothetical protein